MSEREPNTYIERAIEAAGGPTAVARVFAIKPWAVSKWRKSEVPPKRILPLSELVGWQITPHQLAPEIYPNPEDGLPFEIREQLQAGQKRAGAA